MYLNGKYAKKNTWKIVAKKLCKDTSIVSCHCLVKYTANAGFSSGDLTKGNTKIQFGDTIKFLYVGSSS